MVTKSMPKGIQKPLKNRPQMAPKSILGPLGELLELSWQPGGLHEASWKALGALLSALGALLRAPGAVLGASMALLKVSRRAPGEPFGRLLGSSGELWEPVCPIFGFIEKPPFFR